MTSKNIEITKKEYDMVAEKRGIQNPQDMSTKELLNTLSRYDSKRKVKSIHIKLRRLGLKKIVKIQNISKNDLNKAKKLQEKSLDELKVIARLRRIKNFKKLTKEDVILTLLKSENNALENNLNFNNNNNNNNDDDETYDAKIRGKISYIRMNT